MWRTRLLKACLLTLLIGANVTAARQAQAQANFDRPGADYASSPVPTGDPADCALTCERDRRCRAWSFNYPTDAAGGAVCWLKSNVPVRTQNNCCVSGVRGAGVVEQHIGPVEILDRPVRRRLQEFRSGRRRGRRGLQGGLHRRQQVPRLDLCEARLCRPRRALLSEKGHQAAAAQAGIHLGRGAVGVRLQGGQSRPARTRRVACPPSRVQLE